jgi:hypothetical protein
MGEAATCGGTLGLAEAAGELGLDGGGAEDMGLGVQAENHSSKHNAAR